MKKIIISAIAAVTLFSCDMDKQPLDKVIPETFYNNASDLQLHTNSFYGMVPSAEDVYNEGHDNIIKSDVPDEIRGTRVVPTSGGGWSWSDLRNINFYLTNSVKCPDVKARNRYDAVARFFRAWFYYDMVARFGDVPWHDKVMDENDNETLNKPRESRVFIMDKIVADLDFAIANLPTTRTINEVSKWTALALKARVCLFEGTFRKYHTEFNHPDADKFLNAAAEASSELIKSSGYSIYQSGNPNEDYMMLFASLEANKTEVILARGFSNDVQVYHNVNYYTMTASYGRPGVEKAVVDSYLMADGTRFTDKPGYKTMQFYEEMQGRDPRLSQTVRTPGYTRIGNKATLVPEFGSTMTGYQLIKFVADESWDTYGKSANDMPVFRYAEALLVYAEAKAELGTLTQDDLDISVNKIRERVDMPALNMASTNSNPDAAFALLNPNVSGANKGVILEIRRERRVELIMESQRWNDILRWKEGATTSRPFLGMYFPALGVYDLDRDGKDDICIYEGTKPALGNLQYLKINSDVTLDGGKSGNIITNPKIAKKWDEKKDYFYPIPIQERLLNPKLTQNAHWDDGIK